jgi:uncharacterized membrane protein
MCPACIIGTAVVVATAGSSGGILALCIGKYRKFFIADGLNLFQGMREKIKWQRATRKRISQ